MSDKQLKFMYVHRMMTDFFTEYLLYPKKNEIYYKMLINEFFKFQNDKKNMDRTIPVNADAWNYISFVQSLNQKKIDEKRKEIAEKKIDPGQRSNIIYNDEDNIVIYNFFYGNNMQTKNESGEELLIPSNYIYMSLNYLENDRLLKLLREFLSGYHGKDI